MTDATDDTGTSTPVGAADQDVDGGTGIIVGVDGSAAAETALDWALAEGALRGQPVTVVRAGDPLSLPAFGLAGVVLPPVDLEGEEARQTELAEQDLAAARARTGSTVPASAWGVAAPPRVALVDAADRAALVVVGRRGAGQLRRLLVGSVAAAVVSHALGPVAVVPEGWGRRERGGEGRRVVVGYDGSPNSHSALRLGAVEAERRDAVLELVFGWQTVTLADAVTMGSGLLAPITEYRAVADQLLERARAEVEAGPARPRVVTRAAHEPPVAALLAGASDAELLVVGARGSGGFAELLLGSVSTQVTRHAPCPVVVVREGQERLPA